MHTAGHWPWLSHQERQGTVELWTQWLDVSMERTGFPGPAYHPEFHGLNFFTFHHPFMLLLWVCPPSFIPEADLHCCLKPIRIQLKDKASSRSRGLEQKKRLACSLASHCDLSGPAFHSHFSWPIWITHSKSPNSLLFLWQGQFPTMLALGGSILPQPCQILDSLY